MSKFVIGMILINGMAGLTAMAYTAVKKCFYSFVEEHNKEIEYLSCKICQLERQLFEVQQELEKRKNQDLQTISLNKQVEKFVHDTYEII